MKPLLALAALLLAPAPGGLAHEWPFGDAVRTSRFKGWDLYNLGLLGAKGRDPRHPLPGDEPTAGGVRSFSIDRSGGDEGPDELVVEIVLPGGPAARAGLEVGDVVVGVQGRSFGDGSLEPLAKALLKAEAGQGRVTLSVRKGGGDKEKIDVEIEPGGRDAARPEDGAARTRMIEAACAWLADRQRPDGGFDETLSGANGAVVMTSLAGLAWLGAGSDLRQGPHAEAVGKAATFVVETLPRIEGIAESSAGGPSWNQSNWGYAHAAIFLGELWHRTPTDEVTETLLRCGKTLAERQEASGGWAHGPGGKNALGYLELNIVTGLALAGIGLAAQAGYEVPEEVLEKAEVYLERSSSGGGGVGYSAEDGKRGQGNIGRSAGAWLGYRCLGRGRKPWGKKMGAYVKRNAGAVLEGHASLMQHYLLAGVAAGAQGGAARKAFWETARRDLVLARSPDGSFQPRPWHETEGMKSNTDVTFGEVWTTAAWAVVLASEPERGGRPGLPAWRGETADGLDR